MFVAAQCQYLDWQRHIWWYCLYSMNWDERWLFVLLILVELLTIAFFTDKTKQQNVGLRFSNIMKRKFKQWWSSIPPLSTKRTNTTELTEHKKKTTIYNVGNPVPGFRSGTKRWWGSRPSPMEIHIETNHKKSSM
jgi:hypothetical protein